MATSGLAAQPPSQQLLPLAEGEDNKPAFLQPAFDLSGSLSSSLGRKQRPPRPPPDASGGAEVLILDGGGDSNRTTPDLILPPSTPALPSSSRGASPRHRRLHSARGSGGATTPRSGGGSRPSSGAGGGGPSSSRGASASPATGSPSSSPLPYEPQQPQQFSVGYPTGGGGSSSSSTLPMGDYLPMRDYMGIMELSKELREQNKILRAELISARVESERLIAEEAFLREGAIKAGLQPPPEVLRPQQDPARPSSPWTGCN